MSFEQVLGDVSDAAIQEAALRFRRGEVPGQNKAFAPSSAEFNDEAKRLHDLLPYRDRPKIPAPRREPAPVQTPAERARMRLKMPMLRHAFRSREMMSALDRANRSGFGAMVVLSRDWGIPIPDELLSIPDDQAEQEWRTARNRAWAEIERNPPPFLRRRSAYREAAE